MEQFLNIGLGVGILMLFVLLFKQEKKREDYFFLSWIILILLQIVFYEITLYQFKLKGLLAIVGFSLPLLSAPLLFLYIASLTGKRLNKTTICLHLSFFVLYIGVLCSINLLTNASIITNMGYLQIDSDFFVFNDYYAIPLAISGITYGIWDLYLLKQHRRRIAELFSYNEKINLKWVQYIVYLYFLLVLIASFLIFGSGQFGLFEVSDAFAFLGIALSALLITFGFYGFKQTGVFMNMDSPHPDEGNHSDDYGQLSSQYVKSGLTEEKIMLYAKQVTDHMKQEKPYLQDDLTLTILAEQCNLSNVHLSQVLNQHFQLNFYDFVNQYRIEESKKMLTSPDYDNLSVLGIAFNCGFKSKSSFNRYFKKYNGVSPSVFKGKKP
ncbi:MAG: hypothetical protein CR994_03985 [Maribacter sp.]|nr:MAG: hypothetical protein CR994_03985 [Maribacter sp.]